MFGLISIDSIGNDVAMFYSEIKEPPGHHSLVVLYVDEEGPTKITAPGDGRLLVHVEWRL
jgi:hypothetical protein